MDIPSTVEALRDIPYVPGGHERQQLDLYLPKEHTENPRPLVIWVHGGGWRNGNRFPCPALFLTQYGYAVASVGYRLSDSAIFPAQIHDCKAAVRYLRAHAAEHRLDPNRFGAWGSSAGGHLVALLGTSGNAPELEGDLGEHTQVSSQVQAVCDYFGPTDLLQMAAQSSANSRLDHDAPTSPESRLVGGPLQQQKDLARTANPIVYADATDPPFLIVHGDADPLVPVAQSQLLLEALETAQVPASLVTMAGGGHGPFRDEPDLVRVREFFDRTLARKQVVDWSKPIKVFVLAGQSNMEGHAKIETFDYVGDDPATAPLLDMMRDANGNPRVAEGAWISYLTGSGEAQGEGFGKLTSGYGARRNPLEDGGKIGPEFTFGLTMDAAFDEPVLIIKTAWGGKSLFYDFRPPSAGAYPRTAQDIEKGRNLEEGSGHYYRMMIAHVKHVLSDIERVCPGYRAEQRYELAGFVWFQGFNDMVNRSVYPELPPESPENRFANYSYWLTDLIRDVRRDLDAPQLPVVIGVMGVSGAQANEGNLQFRQAMAAPASLPEFQGNVRAVATAPYWDEPLAAIQEKYEQVKQMAHLLRTKNKNHANADGAMSEAEQQAYLQNFTAELISPQEVALRERGASNAGYHYLGCAKTFAQIGHAFAEAILDMQ